MDPVASHGLEVVDGGAGLVEAVGGNEDVVGVGQGPEAGVKGPVSVLGEGKAIAGVVVPTVGKFVDVSGFDDAAGVDGGEAVAGEGAGVVVSGDDSEAETGLATGLAGGGVAGGVLLDGIGGRDGHSD